MDRVELTRQRVACSQGSCPLERNVESEEKSTTSLGVPRKQSKNTPKLEAEHQVP
jgi:hypothetical protein